MPLSRSIQRVGAIAFLLVRLVCPIAAQDPGTLVGSVVDQQTLRPLADAVVTVAAAGLATRTDEDGNFVLHGVVGPVVEVRIAANGYSTVIETVRIEEEIAFAQFHVLSVASVLDALIVRGRSGGGGRDQGFAHAEVDGRSTDALTAADLVAQRIPGVSVRPSAQGPAHGGRILIRGINSLTGSNEPALFLNGVRIGGPADGIGQALRALQQIPASDVARIRVIRGSSAGPMYGDPANGVILVETRSGAGVR